MHQPDQFAVKFRNCAIHGLPLIQETLPSGLGDRVRNVGLVKDLVLLPKRKPFFKVRGLGDSDMHGVSEMSGK
jgi:hypothetical protein